MCDTIFADTASTASGHALFGKNSDRQRNEAQAVEYHQAQQFARGATVKCTYAVVPQVERTCATLICRPFWMWGAEMGVNEHGVVIGNEGLYSSIGPPVESALTGMDLLRLALERAQTAEEAVEIITGLLAKYGQGGNCGHLLEAYYHNGFLIADRTDAYVLETVGREWVRERAQSVRAISNQYSIGTDFDRMSSSMPALLQAQGWDGASTPNPAQWLSDPKLVHVGSAAARRARATALLRRRAGVISVKDMFRALRDHDPTGQEPDRWDPRAALTYSLCIHAGGGERNAQTTCSLVVDIRPRRPIAWVTGTAAPCISIFKPVMMGWPLPSQGPGLTDRFDPRTLWWRHERLHRAALNIGLEVFLAKIGDERDALEQELLLKVESIAECADEQQIQETIDFCWKRAELLEERWLKEIGSDIQPGRSAYHQAWKDMNEQAGMPG